MARTKVKAKKSIKHTKRSTTSRSIATKVYGLEREFILITGGGFLVIILSMFFLFN